MKNNKGFTLIELLVVIVILLGITVIAVPNILKSFNKRDLKNKEEDIEMLKQYAETYILSDEELYGCLKGTKKYISLDDLATAKGLKTKTSANHGYIIIEDGEIKWVDSLPNNGENYKTCEYQ